MSYSINFGTGAGNESGFKTLEEAKEYANKQAAYTQLAITIEDPEGNLVCRRPWRGTQLDPSVDPSEDPIEFGSFGYYSDWE